VNDVDPSRLSREQRLAAIREFLARHKAPTLVKIECADHRALVGRVMEVPRFGAVLIGKSLPMGARALRPGYGLSLDDMGKTWGWANRRSEVLEPLEGAPWKNAALACIRGHDLLVPLDLISERASEAARGRLSTETLLISYADQKWDHWQLSNE
jgi:hypothetical protein